VSTGSANGILGLGRQVTGEILLDYRRPADDGIEGLCAEKVVANTVPPRELRSSGDVAPSIEDIDSGDRPGIWNI